MLGILRMVYRDKIIGDQMGGQGKRAAGIRAAGNIIIAVMPHLAAGVNHCVADAFAFFVAYGTLEVGLWF